ncbi:MAG: NADH:ubiquinone reductase (Na(+)-transporting) subunit C [Bacteroidales bacterium]|jgi:Na+-transporting NADH:ubiquinone oxidoreductase subunit C|nr:NADH:ubiquinone reductase (Na(+)-transporting) subunit C [Bacteroidales bacterium]
MQRTNFSNKYIFVYITVLVVVIASVLALTATLLQPKQDDNRKIEKMQDILNAVGIESSVENAISTYKQYITEEIIVNSSGDVLGSFSGDGLPSAAFSVNMKEELAKGVEGTYPVMIARIDTLYTFIFPLQGKGLWGPVWGYIALAPDMNTVVGITLDHKGETPGLGAQIATEEFQRQFKGKKIFDNRGNFVSITLVKGSGSARSEHSVDAISGGTLTSNGVSEMLFGSLRVYEQYMKKKLGDVPVKEDSVQVTDSVVDDVKPYRYYNLYDSLSAARRPLSETTVVKRVEIHKQAEETNSPSSVSKSVSTPATPAPVQENPAEAAPVETSTPAITPETKAETTKVSEPAAPESGIDMSQPDGKSTKKSKRKRDKE